MPNDESPIENQWKYDKYSEITAWKNYFSYLVMFAVFAILLYWLSSGIWAIADAITEPVLSVFCHMDFIGYRIYHSSGNAASVQTLILSNGPESAVYDANSSQIHFLGKIFAKLCRHPIAGIRSLYRSNLCLWCIYKRKLAVLSDRDACFVFHYCYRTFHRVFV